MAAFTMTMPATRNLDRFESSDQRVQCVANDDAEQERHHKGLSTTGLGRRERRENAQREFTIFAASTG